ncbi:meiotic recombination protein DMC1-like protein [Iris pallida]|uniref:Meiotic recombination protein DMC1-like protein n=1 Tax=Iris pallida TaxID=29817 RepID=A0AAX6IDJ4_IRIPA|nr:meiotic recombination protein DMC1-like protein [Iris pallida]
MPKTSLTRRFHGGPLILIIGIFVFSLLTYDLFRPGTASSSSSSSPSMSPPLLPRTATSSTSRLRSPAGQQASRSGFENILPSIIHRQPKAPQKALDTRYRRKFYLAGFVRRRQTETTFFFHKTQPYF